MNNSTRSPTTKIQCNEDGSLDEVFGTGDFHLEQMDSNHWWMALETSAGRVVVNLRARGNISAYVEAESPFPAVPSVDHPTERERFEAWADDQGFLLERTLSGDGYQDLRTQGPWDAWQARAACFAGGGPAKDVEAPAAINQDVIDARRYRWLRNDSALLDSPHVYNPDDDCILDGIELDDAIDRLAAGPIEGEGV